MIVLKYGVVLLCVLFLLVLFFRARKLWAEKHAAEEARFRDMSTKNSAAKKLLKQRERLTRQIDGLYKKLDRYRREERENKEKLFTVSQEIENKSRALGQSKEKEKKESLEEELAKLRREKVDLETRGKEIRREMEAAAQSIVEAKNKRDNEVKSAIQKKLRGEKVLESAEALIRGQIE